jgi:hypothetical protein
VPRKVLGPNRQEVTRTSGNCIIWSVMVRNRTLFRSSNKEGNGWKARHVLVSGNAHTASVLELEKDHLKDPDIVGRIILMWILK